MQKMPGDHGSPRDRSVELENDEFFVDPYSGEILGARKWGKLSQGPKNLLPFLYQLHYTLAMGTTGSLIFCIVAQLWTVDCFIGAYLTFPAPRRSRNIPARTRSWWQDWGKAWLVKTGSLYKLTFTWHRASGLWVWGLLFVFAWSAVALTMHEVYYPVMRTLFTMDEEIELPDRETPLETPELDWEKALFRARELMAEQAESHGFVTSQERRISYDPAHGAYHYQTASNLDVNNRYPSTTIWFSGETGELLGFYAPTGRAAGDTITTWLLALHFGAVGGRAIRLLWRSSEFWSPF